MARAVLPLYLLPPISWWAIVVQHNAVMLDIGERWVKQSHRNRFEIAGPNGVQKLSVPTIKATRTCLRDVAINYAEPWQKLHWRSLEAAYNRSPFFEFYKDELQVIFFTKYHHLAELGLALVHWCANKLQVSTTFEVSNAYVELDEKELDYRMEIPEHTPVEYYQVFTDKHRFIPNLSILDALFNCGPEAPSYL